MERSAALVRAAVGRLEADRERVMREYEAKVKLENQEDMRRLEEEMRRAFKRADESYMLGARNASRLENWKAAPFARNIMSSFRLPPRRRLRGDVQPNVEQRFQFGLLLEHLPRDDRERVAQVASLGDGVVENLRRLLRGFDGETRVVGDARVAGDDGRRRHAAKGDDVTSKTPRALRFALEDGVFESVQTFDG